jgi:[acyl-carrier-protein] S-malonyltransferase
MRAIPLTVSAPFHCRLIASAAEAMREALAGVALKVPVVPVVANVTSAPVSEPDQIRALLVKQVTGTVRWRESVVYMAGQGVGRLVEVGTGKVLAGLAKRIAREVASANVAEPADVAAFAAARQPV